MHIFEILKNANQNFMDNGNVQIKEGYLFQYRFIQLLKSLIPKQVNLAKELMDVLDVSQDGAYRRLRCETAFSLDEAVKICFHYSVPLEALNNEVPDVVTFHFHELDNEVARFRGYLTGLTQQLSAFRKHHSPHIHYAAEDIPMFYHFGWSELASFKVLYWMKSILNVPELEQIRFPFDVAEWIDPQVFEQLYQLYAEIPGTEIWSDETIESTLQQIRFYWDAGFFENKESALVILNQTEEMIRRMARQAETGQKIGYNGASTGAPLKLYLCDLMIGNNSIYVETGDSAASFIGYNTFNSVMTKNEAFNRQHWRWMENLSKKSIQISGMAEKIRNQFFKGQLRKVETLKQHIVSDIED
jgi:hypothetical protein